jgi:MFS family permease
MRTHFSSYNIKNIALFYWITLFINGWFIMPNWVFYFRQYLTQTQVGLVEGVAVLVGILMEIPSGALADLIGKKRAMILGSLFQIASCVILINARDFTHFLLGNVVMFLGFACHSGATEAFAYDSLKESGQANKYSEVIGKSSSITIAAILFATFVGGYLYSLHPAGAFYAWMIFLMISIILLLFTTEPHVDSEKFSLKSYLIHLKEGTKTLFNHKLRNYLVPLLAFVMFVKLYEGLVRQSTAAYFGYTGETFGYLFALVSIPAIYLSFKFGRIREKIADKPLILLNLFGFMLSFFVASLTSNLYVGAGYFLVMNIIRNMVGPLTSSLINDRIDSKHRTTTLSTLALFSQLPYIVLVIGFAYMTEAANLPTLLLIYALVSLIVLIYSAFFVKKDSSLS